MQQLPDVEGVLKQHLPFVYKHLPQWFISYLRHLVREEDLKQLLLKFKDFHGMEFVNRVLEDFKIQVNYVMTNMFSGRRFIFVANHPVGSFDGLALLSVINRLFGDVKIVLNEMLLYLNSLASLAVPVNVYGNLKKHQLEALNRAFESDKHIIIFPAGTVSLFIKGRVQDRPWRKTFIRKAIEFERDIVPVFVDAFNSKLYYIVGTLRQLLKLKVNVEIFMLPREIFRFKNRKINLIFGQPISYKTFTSDKPIEYWVNYVREQLMSLRKYKRWTKASLFQPHTYFEPAESLVVT